MTIVRGTLPGGIKRNAVLERSYALKPLTGHLEMILVGEDSIRADSFPARVTEILSCALDSLGGQSVEPDQVRQLSVGDRQFLMKELAALLHPQPQWVSADCRDCGETMDVSFRYADLPVKDAGHGYPMVQCQLNGGEWVLRTPSGADQEAIARGDSDGIDDKDTLKQLLARLLVEDAPQANDTAEPVAELSESAVADLEAAVESITPEVGTQLLTQCPHCEVENRIDLDLYEFLNRTNHELLTEIHQLAAHYHWSEDNILRLPRSRRKCYLALIDRSRGMVGDHN